MKHKTKKLLYNVSSLILPVAITLSSWFMCNYYFNQPIVKYSVSKDKCVGVELLTKCIPCEDFNFNQSYQTVYIK